MWSYIEYFSSRHDDEAKLRPYSLPVSEYGIHQGILSSIHKSNNRPKNYN